MMWGCKSLLLAVLVAVAADGHAQVYKWSDASGKVHYTDNKDEAERANGLQLKMAPGPTDADRELVMQNLRRQQDMAREKRAMAPPVMHPVAATRPVARPWSSNGGPETDQSRCNLARNVKDGSVRHPNGAKIDANDRQVADADIAAFCH